MATKTTITCDRCHVTHEISTDKAKQFYTVNLLPRDSDMHDTHYYRQYIPSKTAMDLCRDCAKFITEPLPIIEKAEKRS